MQGALLTLMLLCSPWELTTPERLTVMHNCFKEEAVSLDDTYRVVMGDQPEWVRLALPYISKIVIAPYYTGVVADCWPSILYAVIPLGNYGGYALILHPVLFQEEGRPGLARAFLHLALVIQWRRPANSGELYACLR